MCASEACDERAGRQAQAQMGRQRAGKGSERSEDDSDLLAHGGRVQAAARAQAVEQAQAQAQQVKVVACLPCW